MEPSGFSDDEDFEESSRGGRTAEEKLKRSLFDDDEGMCLNSVFLTAPLLTEKWQLLFHWVTNLNYFFKRYGNYLKLHLRILRRRRNNLKRKKMLILQMRMKWLISL